MVWFLTKTVLIKSLIYAKRPLGGSREFEIHERSIVKINKGNGLIYESAVSGLRRRLIVN